MILQGPTLANIAPVVPQPPPVTAATVTVPSAVVDLTGHTMNIRYGQRVFSVPLPLALQTQIETFIQQQIEIDQGWAPGSSSIVTP